MDHRPNILFVFADQLRGSSLGHVGKENVHTPNLDAFAREGIRFTRAVANCPLCCPMRASLITGLHPLSHHVVTNDFPLKTDVPSIAKSLGAAGYDTAYIGKWHLDLADRGCFTPPGPRRQGFDYWAACNCNHSYFEAFYYRDEPEPIWIDGYEPTAQTDLAIDYLRGASGREKPFCLFLSWGPPHCPYDHVPKLFRDMYPPESITPRPNAVNPDLEIIGGYYAHVTALDWNFGRLMQAVGEMGLAEDTLVIFTSDHGDMLFSQDRGWKCKPWRESVIVPFIARWPGRVPAGAEEDATFGLVNVMPTLLALTGTPIPSEVEGDPLPHLLTGSPGPRPESTPIYFHVSPTHYSCREWRGVVTRTHTYARFRERPWLLYDDSTDPYQFHNLIGDPASARVRTNLEAELGRWIERMNDGFESTPDLAARLGIETDERYVVPCYYQPEILEEMRRRSVDREERMRRA